MQKVYFRFISSTRFLKPITKLITFIVNNKKSIIEFYESNLSNIFPPYEIKYILIKKQLK